MISNDIIADPIPVWDAALPEKISGPASHAIGYLVKRAKIPYDLVIAMVRAGVIWEAPSEKLEYPLVFGNEKSGYAEVIETESDYSNRYVISQPGNETFWVYDPDGMLRGVPDIGRFWNRVRWDNLVNRAYICESAIEAVSLYALLPEHAKESCVVFGCGRDPVRAATAAYTAMKHGLKPVIASPDSDFRKILTEIMPESPVIAPKIASWNVELGGEIARWQGRYFHVPKSSEYVICGESEPYEPMTTKYHDVIGGDPYVWDSELRMRLPIKAPIKFYESMEDARHTSKNPEYEPETYGKKVMPLEQWIRQNMPEPKKTPPISSNSIISRIRNKRQSESEKNNAEQAQ